MRRIVAISVFVSMVTALLVASPSLADSGGRGRRRARRLHARRSRRASWASWRGWVTTSAEQKADANGTTVDLVLSPAQRDDLVSGASTPS